ncbi:uncharacterized protein [Mytilus edulis]|uniref:uncharacterized protein n=1 Tax=Mytilus edulis TaxID=6550 RepID=UPI0039EE1E14
MDAELTEFLNDLQNFNDKMFYDSDSDEDEDDIIPDREIQEDPCVNENLSIYSTFHGYTVHKAYDGEKIRVGLRVVKPQSWTPDGDYKYGDGRVIGTIVNVNETGHITVQWDTEGYEEFKKGTNNYYELLLFDNAQTAVKHIYVQCDGCDEYPIRGIRWKCLTCANYDLCTDCYMSDEHDLSHIFKRMLSTHSKGVQMPPRENQDFTFGYGILPTSYVQLRSDHKQQGQVLHFLDKTIETFRSDAKVTWSDNLNGRYCVGRNGQCDLKLIDAAKGPMYYEDHLPIVTYDNVKTGARVVRGPGWDNNTDFDGGHGYVGTVTNVGEVQTNDDTPSRAETLKHRRFSQKRKSKVVRDTQKSDITVQWDNGNTSEYKFSKNCLRLFDNGPSGVDHEGYLCDCCKTANTIRGIRWKCMSKVSKECGDFDLCNSCYMSNEHDLSHKFQRIVVPNMRENIEFSRDKSKSSLRQSHGIFEGATVVKVSEENEVKEGTVTAIVDCKIDIGRSEVEVEWNDDTITAKQILELTYDCGGTYFYYNDHLPLLGRDSRGYFEINFDFDGGTTKKIQIAIWRTIQQERKLTFKPSLYLIFANHPELDKKDDEMTFLDEVIDFAKKTKLPCHVVGQRVMFHSGSTHSVFIHHSTEKNTVEELIKKKGFRKFERGDIDDEDEDEIHYFIRMAEYVMGEVVLPVIISLRNGGMTTDVMTSAAESHIPIIRLKKHSLDVSVLTPISSDDCSVQMKEHRTDIKNPWSVKKSKPRDYELGKYDGENDPDEIALISEIQSDFRDNLDALVCCLIIGVSMEEESMEKKIYGSYTDVYPNALSMYLLKEGKWGIPKEHIKKSFSHKSIEYIYEEDMTSEIKDGLWSYLKSRTRMAYKTPDFRDSDSEASDSENDEEERHSDADNPRRSRLVNRRFNKADPNLKGRNIKLNVSVSQLYGLILFALLQKQYWSGAKQLIETGCIRIHHILIGCVILEDAVNNWRTNLFLKEKLQRFKSAFTQRAIRITSCINEADKKKKDISRKRKEKKIQDHGNDSENEEEKELGEYINHAGRLLLNHGYIEDAIKTQNKTFLDNNTVKNILNEMWYGTEKLDSRTILCFIGLAVVHLIVLPLLMINMEARPLLWFYKKYKLPFMKVFMHMLGFLALLTAYAYMLLFDYSDDGITYTDYFIIAWMTSFFVDETKQHIVSIIRRKWKSYASDWWNRLDWLSMIVYASGMLLKLWQGFQFRNASKILLVAAFILLSIRILNLCCMSAILGPKLVMIRKMFRDTFSFMIIMTVIMMCYNISFYALLYPNSEFSWSQMEKIIQNGYWMLFGELNLDGDTLSEPHCTFNRTLYENTDIQRCPEQIGVYITPYLKALYGLIAVILLLNLLIAMYSDTFQNVQQESEFYWSQLQTDFLEEYSIKTIFPIHLQLLIIPAIIIHALLWFCCPYLCGKLYRKCRRDDIYYTMWDEFGEEATLNHRPMFVRVFLYNTNFDLKLKTTKEAEGNGALKAKGEIDLMEVDRFTMLQRQMENNSMKQDKQNDTNDKRIQKIIGGLQNMDKKMNVMKKLLTKIAKSTTNYDDITDEEEDENVFNCSLSDEDDDDSQSISSNEELRKDPECKMQ